MKRVLIICSLGLLSLSAQAQDSDTSVAERLQNCAELDSGVARLDCYDDLALEVAAESGSEGAEREQGREMAQERGERGRERAEEARQRGQQQREERSVSEKQEQRESSEGEDEDGKRYISIEERWQNSRGLWRFRTAEGDEWAQLEADQQFPMQDDANYYIESGFFSSYSLSHDDTNRRLRIRPVD